MKAIVKVVLFIWQLPQNILGFFLSLGGKKIDVVGGKVYVKKYLFNSAVSLGSFVIIDSRRFKTDTVIKHMQGHQKHSLYLGPMYLLTVGIPSFCRNIWDRIAHRKWPIQKRLDWYYSGYPEKSADELGGVNRKTSV